MGSTSIAGYHAPHRAILWIDPPTPQSQPWSATLALAEAVVERSGAGIFKCVVPAGDVARAEQESNVLWEEWGYSYSTTGAIGGLLVLRCTHDSSNKQNPVHSAPLVNCFQGDRRKKDRENSQKAQHSSDMPCRCSFSPTSKDFFLAR